MQSESEKNTEVGFWKGETKIYKHNTNPLKTE